MPIRLISRGPFLITYDSQTDSWVTNKGMAISVLSQYVDVEPGTTLGRVFDMVDSDPDLKRFLGQYCGCDVDTIHKRPREGGEPIHVITDFEKAEDGTIRDTEMSLADAVVIRPFFYVYTDKVTGERRLEGGHVLWAESSKNEDCGTSIHSQRDASFGFMCGLELRLDPSFVVDDCDEDKHQEADEVTVAFEASIQYTLLDALIAIYEFFGEPPFDKRYQRQVDEDEAILEEIRNRAKLEGGLMVEQPTALPAFNEEGDLPPGVYHATLSDVLERFGQGTIQRRAVADRLKRVYELATTTGYMARFVILDHSSPPSPNRETLTSSSSWRMLSIYRP